MLIDADWCWLMLIDADWYWLMLIDAQVQPGFLVSEYTSGVFPVIVFGGIKANILMLVMLQIDCKLTLDLEDIIRSALTLLPSNLKIGTKSFTTFLVFQTYRNRNIIKLKNSNFLFICLIHISCWSNEDVQKQRGKIKSHGCCEWWGKLSLVRADVAAVPSLTSPQ